MLDGFEIANAFSCCYKIDTSQGIRFDSLGKSVTLNRIWI